MLILQRCFKNSDLYSSVFAGKCVHLCIKPIYKKIWPVIFRVLCHLVTGFGITVVRLCLLFSPWCVLTLESTYFFFSIPFHISQPLSPVPPKEPRYWLNQYLNYEVQIHSTHDDKANIYGHISQGRHLFQELIYWILIIWRQLLLWIRWRNWGRNSGLQIILNLGFKS